MTADHERHPGSIRVGDRLPPLVRRPTRVTLFLFGVSYWTPHTIHYDVESARAEGFTDVLVTANLLSAYNVDLITRWAGSSRCLLELQERNVSPAFAGDVLHVTGTVAEVGSRNGLDTARIDIKITKGDGADVLTGSALVSVTDGASQGFGVAAEE